MKKNSMKKSAVALTLCAALLAGCGSMEWTRHRSTAAAS